MKFFPLLSHSLHFPIPLCVLLLLKSSINVYSNYLHILFLFISLEFFLHPLFNCRLKCFFSPQLFWSGPFHVESVTVLLSQIILSLLCIINLSLAAGTIQDHKNLPQPFHLKTTKTMTTILAATTNQWNCKTQLFWVLQASLIYLSFCYSFSQ